MLFVILGTQDKQFKRLIKAVEKLVIQKKITEEVIVQSGSTSYKSDIIKILNYIPYTEFNDYINKADVIITHGGVGTILSAIKLRKKVIAVARLAKYGEHVNDHQLQIVDKYSKEGYIIKCDELEKLEEKIVQAREFKVKKFKSNTESFLKEFEKLIDELIL